MKRYKWLRPVLAGLASIPVIGTLLSLSKRTHWLFRLWDFPRVQMAVVAAVSTIAHSLLFFRRRPSDVALIAAAGAVVAYQLKRIRAYTPLARRTVARATREDGDNRIVLLITNVQMENTHTDRVIDTIRRNQPDVVLAVEIDERWNAALEELVRDYPHALRHPQDNYYGMVLFSRFELVDPRIEFLVQDDIPSIHTGIRLRSGQVVTLHCLHPRPPEPIRDEPSSPRDAELVVVGRAIGKRKAKEPTIVAGDLNDVAWSSTSELFVRLSGLLDPRAGRGFFNSYNAKNPLFRYPLDHVFHSVHFKLVRIERLPAVGSDHFPILIQLQYEEEAAHEQEPSHRKQGDDRKADETLEQQSQDAATGYDRPRDG
jgi:endonuclease/exonuclease/phosphatase (EEP) superfamily protein YafD